MKLIFRYIVAIIMIPVGVLLGVLGWIQNRRKKALYEEQYKRIMAEMKTDNNPQIEKKGEPG